MRFDRLLITGGAGFLGTNLVRWLLAHRPAAQLLVLDRFATGGSPHNLADLPGPPRLRVVQGDVRDAALMERLAGWADAVLHLAAESHVDRSIDRPRAFVSTNVEGTQAVLDAVRAVGGRRVLHVSTDEVYGALGLEEARRFDEEAPLRPRSPYAASKAGADHLVEAGRITHGLDTVIARSGNNFGPYQHSEKMIPRFVTSLLEGRAVPLYGDGAHVRDWIHVEDCCAALIAALEHGAPGGVYNISAGMERSNRAVTEALLTHTGRDRAYVEHVPDRAGHDRRYALDATRVREELGWRPRRTDFEAALAEVVTWYRGNRAWWAPLR